MLRMTVDKLFAPFLASKEFFLKEYVVDQKNFGNEIMLYESADMKLRFINDRGDFYADISSQVHPAEWFFLNNLLSLLGHEKEMSESVPDLKITNIARIFIQEYEKLKEMLSPTVLPKTRQRLDQLNRKAVARIIKEHDIK